MEEYLICADCEKWHPSKDPSDSVEALTILSTISRNFSQGQRIESQIISAQAASPDERTRNIATKGTRTCSASRTTGVYGNDECVQSGEFVRRTYK